MGHPCSVPSDIGRSLAGELRGYAHRRDVVVLALSPDTVPFAAGVARALRAPLDLFLVRPLVIHGQRRLKVGAIASGGVLLFDPDVIKGHAIPASQVAEIAQAEARDLAQQESGYRAGLAPLDWRNRKVVIVDTGRSTVSTLSMAIAALRRRWAAGIVLASPTMSAASCRALLREADEVVTAVTDEAASEPASRQDGPAVSPAEVGLLLRQCAVPALRSVPAQAGTRRPVETVGRQAS